MQAGEKREHLNVPEALDPTTSTENVANKTPERVAEIEGTRVVGLTEDDENFYVNFTKLQRRRVRTKTDLRLLPTLCILYLFAQLDRSNIGNAKIEGLKEDTHLTDNQWNIVLAVFFVPYFFLGENARQKVRNQVGADCVQRSPATCFSAVSPGLPSIFRFL